MSEQEFEAYLNLLARTLRLSEAQRARIAGELRDHLEARMNELVEEEGLSKEEAVLAALDEFGDANVLASELTIPATRLKRKRLMQTGFATLAAVSLVTFACIGLMPEQSRLLPQAVAQNTGETAESGLQPAGGTVAGATDLRMRVLIAPHAFYQQHVQKTPPKGFDFRIDPVEDLEDLVRQAMQTADVHSVTTPRIILNDREPAQLVLARQAQDLDPQTQQTHSQMQGLFIRVKTATTDDYKNIGVAMEVLTEWENPDGEPGSDTQQLRLPFGDEWEPGFTGARFQYRGLSGSTVACVLPLSTMQLGPLANLGEIDLPQDAIAILLVTATTREPEAPQARSQASNETPLAQIARF